MTKNFGYCLLLLLLTTPVTAETPKEKETAAATTPKKLTRDDLQELPPALRKLVSLHQPLGEPLPGSWLDRHAEAGQSYRQFLLATPVRATAKQRILRIQPLGEFTAEQRRVVEVTAEFLECYFQLPVETNDPQPLKNVPKYAQRVREDENDPQILSTYILDRVLKPQLPADTIACLGLTTSDLWPGDGWNYVFGQAYLQNRVGVWSMHRFGDSAKKTADLPLSWRRTLHTAVHETGQMFSIAHCVYFECAMNGSNHLEEADSQPLWLCPQCQAKLCYATQADPGKRLEALVAFAKKHKLEAEQKFWETSLQHLGTQAK